ILESLKKTNRIVFIDEDVPGGASAYMFQQVMEVQQGYRWLDVAPRTITAQPHRPAYATDGDYFSKPNAESIAEVIRLMMQEYLRSRQIALPSSVPGDGFLLSAGSKQQKQDQQPIMPTERS